LETTGYIFSANWGRKTESNQVDKKYNKDIARNKQEKRGKDNINVSN
jgi:hypothetical protein